MIFQANKNPGNVLLTSSWDKIKSCIAEHKRNGERITLILSSVIHELYNYMSKDDFDEFWNFIFNENFDYIVIRDMMVNKKTTRPSDPLTETRIRQLTNPEKLNSWENNWGGIEENWSLVHFLLTYHYDDNWQREMMENYLPFNKEDFFTMIPSNYFSDYVEHFTLPYIRNKVRRDYGIELADNTHMKLILRKLY